MNMSFCFNNDYIIKEQYILGICKFVDLLI